MMFNCNVIHLDFILNAFLRVNLLYKRFTSTDHRGSVYQNVCDALSYLLDKLYRQIVGIPLGTNCAPLVADLFLFCYEIDFMTSLCGDNQADIIEAFNSTSRYVDDLHNIDNPFFIGMFNQIYTPEQQLNKANTSDTVAPFLDLNLSVSNDFVSSKFMINAMTFILIL